MGRAAACRRSSPGQVHRAGAALARGQHAEAHVRRDAIQPRSERRTTLEAVDATPCAHERLLHGVLGLEGRSQHAIAVSRQLDAIRLQLRHGLFGRRRDHGSFGRQLTHGPTIVPAVRGGRQRPRAAPCVHARPGARLRRAARSANDEAFWRDFLTQGASFERRARQVFKRLPAEPRCRICAAPFAGVGAGLMRLIGKRPSESNPTMCSSCFAFVSRHHGGAEIEVTMLFADIRGSTIAGRGHVVRGLPRAC